MTPRAREQGFTLLELLAVSVIAAVVLGGVVMSASAYSGHSAMTKTVTLLVADLEAVQTRAQFARHTTRLVRLSGGYRCSDDDDTASALNVTRNFPRNIEWAPGGEFAPDSAQILFIRSARPYSDPVTPLTTAKNELVIRVPGGVQKTVEIITGLGRIEVR